MKKKLLQIIFPFFLVLTGVLTTSSLSAQRSDTTLFDYDSYTSCFACGDNLSYNVTGTRDSFTDNTPTKEYLYELKVKYKLFTCLTNAPITLYLNGNAVGVYTSTYNCACNACDSITFTIKSSDIAAYYKYQQKNVFRLATTGSAGLYMDRCIIYKTSTQKFNYDAGVTALDTPATRSCAGNKSVVVTIKNQGKRQFSNVDVYWTWNGVSQTTFSYSGTLDTINGSGNSSAKVKLGTKSFTTGKNDTLVVWTKNPGGVNDSLNINDTLKAIIYTGYRDTLTVGGSSPMFTDIQSAVDALVSTGVCGPTFVKIRPGVYSEQVLIRAIPGSSATNTVTFISSTNDSSDVTINFSANSSNNYTVRFNDASNIVFKHITIEAVNTTYANAVSIIGSAVNLSFSNCHFIGISSSSSSSNYYTLYRNISASTDVTQQIHFNQCRISNGSRGMFFNNSSTFLLDGFSVKKCVFENNYYYNLYSQYSKNVTISQNYFERSNTSSSSGYGLYLYYSIDSLRILQNKIVQNNGSAGGIYLYNSFGSSSNRQLIANNFLSNSTSSTSYYAIRTEYCSYQDIVFNNLYQNTTNTSSYGMYLYEGGNNKLLYNNIYNGNKGIPLYVYSSNSNSLTKSDRNNFYNNGGLLASVYNNSINAIADLKSLKLDSNSISVNPNYTSSTDLHVYNSELKGKARPFAGITNDFDGATRNTSTPDIGADEFKLASLDVGISEFIKPLSGTQCLKVALKNQGQTTVTSAKIDWKLNGVSKSQVSWTGSLATNDTDVVCLGNVTLKDTIYTLKVWSSAPNGGTDSIARNDTINFQFYPAMRGEYTIGGTSPDFSSFTLAVSALKRRGVLDSVYFKVRNGTYTEQIDLTAISGAYRSNAITFESENKNNSLVTLQYNTALSSTNYVVWLNGAAGVTFKNISLKNFSSTYRRVVYVTNSSKLLRFENNLLQNADSTSSTSNAALIFFNSNSGQDFVIKNNIFKNGAYGIYLSSNSSARDRNIIMQGNTFKSQGYNSVYLYTVSDYEFSNNTISLLNNSAYWGFYSYYSIGKANIFNNKINISGVNAYYGLYLDQHYSADSMRVYNNFISISGPTNGYGIYAYYLQPSLIQFNNILNQCTDSSNSSAAIYFYGGDYVLNNNNFVHMGNGYTYYSDYYYSFSANFNNHFTNGTKFIYFDGLDYSNLADFQSTWSLDTNSLFTDPLYVSSTDLHSSSVAINSKGKSISQINRDIDGELRGSPPDIGADEFTPPTNDAGISKLISPGALFRADTINVVVSVINYGIDTIKNVIVQAKINKDTLARKFVSGTLASGDTMHVALGNYIFKADSLYNISAWTNLPNGNADQKRNNDTLKIFNKRSAMTGIYTIGGTSPNFPTFKAAVNTLTASGMLDSVRFKVRSGSYTEQISIPPIAGAYSRNSVVFESQNQDTTSVTLQFNSTKIDTNYVVRFNGADGITFRNLKIRALSSSNFNRVFSIGENAQNITLTNNIIEGTNTSYGDNRNALIYVEEGANHNLHIMNNHIKAGDYGIYVYGYNPTPPYTYLTDLQIVGNRILNPFYYGIHGYSLDSVLIKNNYIFMNKYASSYNVFFERIDKFNISNNTLIIPNSYLGLYMYNCGNNAPYERNLISNNVLYSKNTSNSSYGFYLYYLRNTDILHNTIKMENTNTSSSYALYMYDGSKNALYNNILSHFNTGYSIYLYHNYTLDSSDNNNFYTKGSILGYYAGNGVSNLADWQAVSSKDANSLSLDPLFKGLANLHAKEVNLNAAARSFRRVVYDMDYELRDTLTPDIGADEFQLPPNDAGISSILLPNRPFLPDSQYVKVAIKNYGGNTLYVANIGWKLNGVNQTPISWSDTLASGDTMHVKLAKKFFKRDTVYSMTCWTSQPNGTGDSITSNDTAKVFNIYPALSGVYTIGGATPDFNTFTDAVAAMKRGGIKDSVRFDVRSGVYSEQISIPYIYGAQNPNSIIFQSENRDSSKVWLTYNPTSSKPYVVQLDSTAGITFRHLTIKSAGTSSYNRCIEVLGGANNITIYDCGLIGRTINSTSASDAIIYFYNSNTNEPAAKNVKIYNNRFKSGALGVFNDYGYSSVGISDNFQIDKNVFEDQYYMGVYLYYVNNIYIRNNLMYRNNTGYSNSYGIYCYYSTKGGEISGNTLYNQENLGIYTYEFDGQQGDSFYVYNNSVHCRTNNAVSGITIYYPSYLNFSFNNIHVESTNTGSEAFLLYNPSQTVMYNNNLVNTGSGYAFYLQGTVQQSNFNNLYTNGTYIGYRSGNITNLASWKSATGRDANSLSVDPDYTSATDLHVRNTDLNGKGRRMNYLTRFDIDGEKRDSVTPDIGSDEFILPSANDAGISAYFGPVAPFVAGVNKVKVYVKNNGYDSLKSATVSWSVNGVGQAANNWKGKLKTGQTDTFTVGSYNFASGKAHTLVFWTSSPNGVKDSVSYNDTFIKTNVYPALDGVYTIGGSLPDYTDVNTAINALKLGGVIDSVWFKIRSGTYSTNVTLGAYSGSHPKRPVYFESQSGDSSDVILKSVSSNPVFTLNGGDYIKFKRLTFELSNSSAKGLQISGGSKGLGVSNCHFKTTSNFGGYGIYSSSDVDDSLLVENSYFTNHYYSIYLYGTNGSSKEKGTIIRNNTILSPYYYGIILENLEGSQIVGNTITSTLSSGYPLVYVSNSAGPLVIAYNKINHSATNYGYGIYLTSHVGSSSVRANIYNNFISILGGSTSQYGVNIVSSTYVNFYHNSINIYGSGTNTRCLDVNSGNNLDMRNNIYCNVAGGYALFYNNTPSFTQSNYNDVYTTGTNIGYLNGTNYTTLANWKSATSREANSVSADPAFTSSTDLHSNLISLDSACLPIASVTDDIDRESRNSSRADIGADEFTSLPENLGITQVISPVNSCGLDSSSVSLKIFNFGNKPQSNYPIRYRINGGSIVSVTLSDTLKPAKERTYTFSKKIAFAKNTAFTIQAWTDLSNEKYRKNDSIKTVFTNYSTPDSIKSMSPANGTKDVDYPFSLSWVPTNGSTRYDVYLWKSTDSKPSSPNVSNIAQIGYTIGSGLEYGQKYYWQVIAKNPICSTPGIMNEFTMRFLPDLVVDQVTAPKSAFSSTNISISWKVKNTGNGATSGSWWDFIYLSTDPVYDVTDVYLGGIQNPSGLNSSQTYNQSHTVTLPNGVQGNYYLFVVADKYNNLNEVDNNNNSNRDTGKTVISLTPPPDLIVTSVTRPSNAFSGQPANIIYKVKNNGTGSTRSGGWYDNVYLSTEKVLNNTSYNLGRVWSSYKLDKDSGYTRSLAVNIPNYISGKYFIIVQTDQANHEYEHSAESNNYTSSDTLKVILTPPPDLIVDGVSVADTVSNNESTLLDYFTINDGGTATGRTFYDLVFVCPTSTFNQSISTHIASLHITKNLDSKDSSIIHTHVSIPTSIQGKYYLFVLADYYNHVNEVTKENNNISAGYPIYINSPDLNVSKVQTRNVDSTGTGLYVNYTVFNKGKGADYQDTRTDSFFLSRSSTWIRSKSIPIGARRYNPTKISSNDSINFAANPNIPDGLAGTYYLYIYTDAKSEIFENNQENNNVTRGNLIYIQMSPYPDLKPTLTNQPDSSEAGAVAFIEYDVQNIGTANALPNWIDRVFVSKDSNLLIVYDTNTRKSKFVIPNGSSFSDATPRVRILSSYTRSSALDINKTYSNTINFTIPADMVRGKYYLYLITDVEGKVFEQTDTNNLRRGKKMFIDGYPPVDLSLNIPNQKNWYSINSGENYTLSYNVKNIGDAKTPVGAWNDGIYLSLDSILTPSDILLQSVPINKALEKDSSYSLNRSVKIPNGTSGDYYLLAFADMGKLTSDIDTMNNKNGLRDSTGRLVKIKVNLTPPPDLQITYWDVPSNVTSGQPFEIKWKVENKGTGATKSKNWNDLFYLSTDYIIDNQDILLGNHSFNGNLAVNASYLDSMDVTIPISRVGNFIILLKTDGSNTEYEHTNESNNIVSTVTTATKAPPADLFVNSVTSPDSVLSGKTVNIGWKVKNQGSNPAYGSLRDNIYLSNDNVQDGNDVLLGSYSYYLSLAPSAEISNNVGVTISGIEIGNYNVLVTTDVLNNISESNDTNNTAVAPNLLNVNVPILPIAVKTADSLSDGEFIYHRIVIPDSLIGQSMLVTLKADSINGNNQIYVRHNSLATASDFDYKYREPFKGNQEIIIPALDSGTYYLLTTGSTSNSNAQNITLLARIMPFEIRKVLASSGSNTGEVTVTIEGSKFDEFTNFSLIRNGKAVPGSKTVDTNHLRYRYTGLGAQKTRYIDPTIAYVTFNLAGLDTGKYDVAATTIGATAHLDKGFTVIEGEDGLLNVEIISPANTRANNVLTMEVLFSNGGNTDLVNKKLNILSTSGAPIALTIEDLAKNSNSVEIKVEEENGPPGRLRPEGYGRVIIYTKASGALGFTIIE